MRGATTLDGDTREQVIERTSELLTSLIERNGFHPEDLVSVVFTATSDVRSAFPAEAAADAGLGAVPRLCAREIDVEGAIELCVRVLLLAYTRRPPSELHHVYLHGAEELAIVPPGQQ